MTATSVTQPAESVSMRPFFALWTGQVFSLLGSELVQFALVWWLTTTTGSATVLALGTMMAVLPRIFVSPIAGALVDRWNRRAVMIVADGLSALAVVLLAVLFALDRVQVWHIYALTFIRASAGAFHWPAMQASTTLMVPQKHLARVAGLNQVLYGLAPIVGPPLGALLIEALPIQGVLAVDVGTAMLAIAPLFFVHVPQPERAPATDGAPQGSVIADLREGLRFLRGWPGMLMAMGIAMLVNLFLYPAMSLQPLLATEHFGGDALELAFLQSAFGVGTVAGGIALGVWGGFKRRTVTALSALALHGVGFFVAGMTPANGFPLAVGAMFFAWFTLAIASGSIIAVFQVAIPPNVQGRVFTLLQSGGGAMAPLGLAITGPLVDALGVRFWFVASGVAIAAISVGAFFVPAILNIEDRATAAAAPGKDEPAPVSGDTPVVAASTG
ncbi:MAG: MFS transporter [Anaerolineae bacterium]|nr:MAG: MFS transporter [Anaerolineae bacterium]